MTEFEKNCYGITTEQIRKEYMESLTAKFSGIEMVVAGILSDCQELLAEDGETIYTSDRIRKNLNIAKYILFRQQEVREQFERECA